MKVRGRRRCKECGERWSYYETGSIECPVCGSMHSVGTDESRQLHTDGAVELELAEIRSAVDDRPISEVAEEAESAARRYRASRGFVRGGELRPLDDTFLAACELEYAADAIRRTAEVSADEERYFHALLAGADGGERPEDVPASIRHARGLGVATAVDAYRRDVRSWLEEHPDETVRDTLEAIRDRVRRVEALDGEIPPSDAETLLRAARDVGTYLLDDDVDALARARTLLADA